MAQFIKIDSNAKAEVLRLANIEKNFGELLLDTIHDTLVLARDRIRSQIVPMGAVPSKNGGWKYIQAAGTTIQRLHNMTGLPWGPPVFHKMKVVSRSGEFASIFQPGSPNLSLTVSKKGTGFQGSIDARMANMDRLRGLELGRSGNRARNGNRRIKQKVGKELKAMGQWSGIKREPIWKGLRFAFARFQTMVVEKWVRLQING